MPLIVKPNWRRMQAFRNSPSERGYVRQSRIAAPGKVRLLAIVVIVIALALVAVFLVRP